MEVLGVVIESDSVTDLVHLWYDDAYWSIPRLSSSSKGQHLHTRYSGMLSECQTGLTKIICLILFFMSHQQSFR